MFKFLKSFKISKSIWYPVKELVEEIKNNPQKYEVEISDKDNPTVHVRNKEKSAFTFYIFPTCSPILSAVFRSRMWYNADGIEWMNDKEKSYVYNELLNLKPEINKHLRDKWAEAYNVKKED